MQYSATNHDDERAPTTNRLTEASRDKSASHKLGEANRVTRRLGQRHTVREAAEVLGTTVDAVRGRIRRGTLDSVKLDGVVYVLLDATNRVQQSDKSETDHGDSRQQTGDEAGIVADQPELFGEMRDQIDWLRRESERKDAIIMQMAQANASLAARVPELEAATETRGTTETATEDVSGSETPSPDTSQPRASWWRRWFGFE